ncbi:MAG: rod shape-determining protein MreD [Stellaceae bacterium]|jgi:rod shape-determining protein MreD
MSMRADEGGMTPGLWQRDFGAITKLVPILTTLLFAIVSMLPFHIPGFGSIAPSFALMAVFHWTIYRPDLLPLGAVFGVGVFLDLLNGTPYVGLSALIFLLARTAVLNQRRLFFERPFLVLWLGFLALAAACFLFEWAFVSVMQFTPLLPRLFIFQATITVACFPIGSYFLALAHRAVPTAGV